MTTSSACRFESTITGQFFGHTHKDEFEIFFDDTNKTRATRYIGTMHVSYCLLW